MPMTREQGIKNSRNGEAFEWRQLRKMKSSCLTVVRSSGSRGQFDIWGLQKDKLRLVQCKSNGYIDPAERESIAKFLLEKPMWVQVEVHVRLSHKKVHKYIIKTDKDLEKFAKKIEEDNGESLDKTRDEC